MNRERLTILRDHLANLDPNQFDMSSFANWNEALNLRGRPIGEIAHTCGTTCCVAGWSNAIFRPNESEGDLGDESASADLGLNEEQKTSLFFPSGWLASRQTNADAVAAIQSMLDSPDDDALPVWPEPVEA